MSSGFPPGEQNTKQFLSEQPPTVPAGAAAQGLRRLHLNNNWGKGSGEASEGKTDLTTCN